MVLNGIITINGISSLTCSWLTWWRTTHESFLWVSSPQWFQWINPTKIPCKSLGSYFSGLTLLIPFITGVITHLRFVGSSPPSIPCISGHSCTFPRSLSCHPIARGRTELLAQGHLRLASFLRHGCGDRHRTVPRRSPGWDQGTPEPSMFLFHALLVGDLEHFLFFHTLGIIIPTD